MPGRSKLLQGRFQSDGAITNAMGKRHAEMIRQQPVIYPLADSSQFKFGNVFCQGYFAVEAGQVLLAAGHAALQLKQLPGPI